MSSAKAKAPLKFNKAKEIALHRLPFVGKEPDKPGLSFWKVPATGGYAGGCATGAALATIYLDHLKKHGEDQVGSYLQCIVLDMLGVDNPKRKGQDALHGQIVGFFSFIEQCLLRQSGVTLNDEGLQVMLAAANRGLTAEEV